MNGVRAKDKAEPSSSFHMSERVIGQLKGLTIDTAFTILSAIHWDLDKIEGLHTFLKLRTQFRSNTDDNLDFAYDVLLAGDALRQFDFLQDVTDGVSMFWHIYAIVACAELVIHGQDLREEFRRYLEEMRDEDCLPSASEGEITTEITDEEAGQAFDEVRRNRCPLSGRMRLTDPIDEPGVAGRQHFY
jgi:hypothetical protein